MSETPSPYVNINVSKPIYFCIFLILPAVFVLTPVSTNVTLNDSVFEFDLSKIKVLSKMTTVSDTYVINVSGKGKYSENNFVVYSWMFRRS